jgi:hypothetical protein
MVNDTSGISSYIALRGDRIDSKEPGRTWREVVMVYVVV